MKKLNEVAKFFHGGTPNRGDSALWGNHLPWVSPKDMKVNEIGNAHDWLSASGAESKQAGVVQPGTILVVARSGILKHTLPVALATRDLAFNQDIKAIMPNKSILDSGYLAVWLKSQEPVVLAHGVKVGPTVHSLKSGYLESMEIPLPDLPTQRRLAARLKSQMAAIEETRRRVQEQAREAIVLLDKTIAESFHGITPLSVGRDESTAPAGWHWKGLLELARLESGHTPSRRFPEYWAEGDIPWLALPDIRALDCRTATQTSEKTNALGIANSSARVLPAGTVALCRTASVGYVTQFGCEMATSQHFANYLCGPSLHPRFLMWQFRTSRSFLQSQSTGSVLPDIYMNVIHKFRVCLPDLKQQQRIADCLDETFRLNQQLQKALSTQLEALDKLPGAYLREAFANLQ